MGRAVSKAGLGAELPACFPSSLKMLVSLEKELPVWHTRVVLSKKVKKSG